MGCAGEEIAPFNTRNEKLNLWAIKRSLTQFSAPRDFTVTACLGRPWPAGSVTTTNYHSRNLLETNSQMTVKHFLTSRNFPESFQSLKVWRKVPSLEWPSLLDNKKDVNLILLVNTHLYHLEKSSRLLWKSNCVSNTLCGLSRHEQPAWDRQSV